MKLTRRQFVQSIALLPATLILPDLEIIIPDRPTTGDVEQLSETIMSVVKLATHATHRPSWAHHVVGVVEQTVFYTGHVVAFGISMQPAAWEHIGEVRRSVQHADTSIIDLDMTVTKLPTLMPEFGVVEMNIVVEDQHNIIRGIDVILERARLCTSKPDRLLVESTPNTKKWIVVK